MNSASNDTTPPRGRLDRLLAYLGADPQNLSLLNDAAECALAERRPEVALDLLKRHTHIAPLSPPQKNMEGLAALQTQDYHLAASIFSDLRAEAPDDPSLRYNLAWSKAKLNDYDGALACLDDAVAAALPQGAALYIRMLHHKGDLETAEHVARRSLAAFPQDQGLAAVVSTLAVDIDDLDLARSCARCGGDHPDALASLGVLALHDGDRAEAIALFERALLRQPDSARALVGKGLTQLSSPHPKTSLEAAQTIEKGAKLFGDHIGSWIAAGWAYFFAGDRTSAQTCFEKALSIDDTFAESHGSLAVLAVSDNRHDEARRLADVAYRLDKQCFSAALARALLLHASGNSVPAKDIIERAMTYPIDQRGTTLADAIAKLGLSM